MDANFFSAVILRSVEKKRLVQPRVYFALAGPTHEHEEHQEINESYSNKCKVSVAITCFVATETKL